MAAIGFDSFEYAKELETAGMSRQLAEVVAKGMTKSFVHNFDALVTKDYLDARLNQFREEFNAWFAQIDTRFEQIDARFEQIDTRFEQIDTRFEQIDARFEQIDARFERLESRFEQMESRFQQLEARFDQLEDRFGHLGELTDARFDQFAAEFNGKLGTIQVMLAVVMAGVAIPVVQSLTVLLNQL